MRPVADWQEVSKEVARVLRRHGVRTKAVLSADRTKVVHRVPPWIIEVAGRDGEHLKNGQMRRALRRAVRDPEFRLALQAALVVGLERTFLTNQELDEP